MTDTGQQGLAHYLRSGDSSGLAQCFMPGGNMAYAAVYRNGFLRACVDALAANFPAVLAQLGAGPFNTLARAYITAFPPAVPTLVAYGQQFPDFIDASAAPGCVAWLQDLARIDQAWLQSFFAAEGQPLGVGWLQQAVADGVEIGQLAIALLPHVRRVTTPHEVFDLWRDLHEQTALNISPGIAATPQEILLWRNENDILLRVMSPAEAQFLDQLNSTGQLTDAALAALAINPRFDVTATLAALLGNGLLQPATTVE